jgi:glycosyltransferase involved in cell wall biosynthesis
MKGRILYGNATAVHGGAEEVLVRYMEAARELGNEPVLLVPETGWLTDACRSRGISFELLPSLPRPFVDSAAYQFRPWMPNAIRIARLIRRLGVDWVHANSPRLSYHLGLGARLAGVPSVAHVHDIVRLPYASRAKARLLARLNDRTVAVSRAVERALLDLAPSLRGRIHVVYNGWDATEYAGVVPADFHALYGFPPGSLVIGNVAAMTPWKGQDVLIEAFAALARDRPEARLLVVGGVQDQALQGPYEQSLRRRAVDLGIESRVVFTGWREDATSFILAMDVLVHAPTRPDPLPTVLLHGSALGRAIVASRIGGIPEIVEDEAGGILVPPSDSRALRSALDRMAADPERRRAMGARAAERFRRVFSRKQMQEGLAAVYASLDSSSARACIASE